MANEEDTQGTTLAFRPEITRRRPDLPSGPSGLLRGSQSGNKLIVGRDIVLNGQITACEQLVVEGRVETALENSQSIEIAETGVFKGSAVIEEADISGRFEGNMTVRGELTVRATGRIKGEIKYGKLSIESGGQIIGTMEVLTAGASATATLVPSAGENT